jgi:hypothetical protein
MLHGACRPVPASAGCCVLYSEGKGEKRGKIKRVSKKNKSAHPHPHTHPHPRPHTHRGGACCRCGAGEPQAQPPPAHYKPAKQPTRVSGPDKTMQPGAPASLHPPASAHFFGIRPSHHHKHVLTWRRSDRSQRASLAITIKTVRFLPSPRAERSAESLRSSNPNWPSLLSSARAKSPSPVSQESPVSQGSPASP